jgi:hypothetical protein
VGRLAFYEDADLLEDLKLGGRGSVVQLRDVKVRRPIPAVS